MITFAPLFAVILSPILSLVPKLFAYDFVSWIGSVGVAFDSALTYLKFLDTFLPIGSFITVLSIYLTFEFFLLGIRVFRWVLSIIPFLNIKN